VAIANHNIFTRALAVANIDDGSRAVTVCDGNTGARTRAGNNEHVVSLIVLDNPLLTPLCRLVLFLPGQERQAAKEQHTMCGEHTMCDE